jgi:hypothetical protein
MPTFRQSHPDPHPLPHLQEICAILATGLVRLRRHTAEEVAEDAAWVGGEVENSLHFRSDQSSYALPIRRRNA